MKKVQFKNLKKKNSRRTYEKRTFLKHARKIYIYIYISSPDENLCEFRVRELVLISSAANASTSSPGGRTIRTVVLRGWKSGFRPPQAPTPQRPPLSATRSVRVHWKRPSDKLKSEHKGTIDLGSFIFFQDVRSLLNYNLKKIHMTSFVLRKLIP